MDIKKIAILTSGGDAPGMNASIRAIVRSALSYGIECYGVYDGYKGLYEDNIRPLNRIDVSGILRRGGTILGSARFMDFAKEEVRQVAINNLKERGIDALITIGGDGTFKGAYKLCTMGFPCIGIPGTIDNDVASTEYTIGFDTTLNTIVECVDRLRDTSFSHARCSVIEVMGRRYPDLAIRAGISCGAEYVICNENQVTDEQIIQAAHDAKKLNKRDCIIIVCEHTINVKHIEEILNADGTYETRSCVLGHLQRGGSPSAFDRVLASRLGDYAVRLLIEGTNGVYVGIKGQELINTSMKDSGEIKKEFPIELIEESNRLI